MNFLKVCVVIANYNHSKFLDVSIESIIKQSYNNLDIVVVDDGSHDQQEVDKIIQNFSDDKRLRCIKFKQNTGKWNALNHAISTTDAVVCTSHDADDISLDWRIEAQLTTLLQTKTIHNLCGFHSCWNEKEVEEKLKNKEKPQSYRVLNSEDVTKLVLTGFDKPGINHYFTGSFETAGVSSMFYKRIWDLGFRYNPPNQGLRTLLSEDSDFNFRVTAGLRSTSILLEAPYLYRRNTSTNKEEI